MSDVRAFQAELLAWYDQVKRDLPWRRYSGDPYAVWVSEIMLQQTTVAAVIPYYERWMARFPTVEVLALASMDEVLGLWQGLGYYRRCRNLHAGALWVVSHGWPSDLAGWKAVPGVGEYTAGAILSIAGGVGVPAVDGNVKRVYSRICDDGSADALLGRNALAWASEVVSLDRPGDWTQALMELGAVVCRPKNPDCGACPVTRCLARDRGTQELRPSVGAKPIKKVLAWDVLIAVRGSMVALRQVPEGEWWHGLWEFPRVPVEDFRPGLLGKVKTVVTNHAITFLVYLSDDEELPEGFVWVESARLAELPLSAPMRRVADLALKARVFEFELPRG